MAAVQRSRRARRSATGGAGGFGQGRTDRVCSGGGGGLTFVAMPKQPKAGAGRAGVSKPGKPSSLLDTRVVYCGDNLEQLKKLPDRCVDLIYPSAEAQPQRTISRQALRRIAAISSAFNRAPNYEVFWGETKEKRAVFDLLQTDFVVSC